LIGFLLVFLSGNALNSRANAMVGKLACYIAGDAGDQMNGRVPSLVSKNMTLYSYVNEEDLLAKLLNKFRHTLIDSGPRMVVMLKRFHESALSLHLS
jgi:hypothetical protein